MQLTKYKTIENLIRSRDCVTCCEIIDATGFNEKTVSSILAKFKKNKQIYIGKYALNYNYRVVKAFKWGSAKDAKFEEPDRSNLVPVQKTETPKFVPRLDVAAQWIPARSEQELAAVNDSWIDYIVRYRR
jgi:hypothetical protein